MDLLRSGVHTGAPGPLRRLKPLVTARDFVRAVFEKLVEMIWGELMGKADDWSQAQHLAAFGIFTVLALVQHHLGWIWNAIVPLTIALWSLDSFLAKRAFALGECRRPTALGEEGDGSLVWREEGTTHWASFTPAQVRGVWVERARLEGGVFHEELGIAWRFGLTLDSGDGLTIGEEESASAALAKARELAGRFKAALKVVGSEGRGSLASLEPSEGNGPGGAVSARQEDGALRVESRWTSGSLWLCCRQVVVESGFLLFVLGVGRVMRGFGALFNALFGPSLGLPVDGTVVIDLTPGGILGLFNPAADPLDAAEFCLAVGLMIRSAWRLSRPKAVKAGPERTTVLDGEGVSTVLKTAELEPPLLVRQGGPVILLCDRERSAEIADLHGAEAYEEMREALDGLRPRDGAGSSLR